MKDAMQLSYKIEYETTNITIEEMEAKYNTTITGYEGWTKEGGEPLEEPELETEPLEEPEQPKVIDLVPEPEEIQRVIVPADEPMDLQQIEEIQKLVPTAAPEASEDEMDRDIKGFKKLAIKHAMHFMKEEAKFADVKEFKDIVSIVDTIDKSRKGVVETGPTVNIMIQNLAERFIDDC